MKCPNCGGDMWDNRQKKKNPKAPDYKCKDKNCDGVIWPGESVETHFAHENPSSGPVRSEATRAKGEHFHHQNGLDERQRAIIRQHSQSMALEVLKLKVALNELTMEDLTPVKLRSLADYFDNDVLGASQ